MEPVRIYLETGKNWVFASALDWPGWSRRGKGEEAAIDTFLSYARRYAEVVGPGAGGAVGESGGAAGGAARRGSGGAAGGAARGKRGGAARDLASCTSVDVVGRVDSRAGMADFGAPGAVGPWDDEPLSEAELDRHVSLLEDAWSYLDAVARASPAELRKGPRGGGRDRDAMLRHVQEAERAYSPKVGCRVPPRTPWDDQRRMIADALRAAPAETIWPLRYTIRRTAWHVLDHAWEMQDKAE
jgi:hypothetical protein